MEAGFGTRHSGLGSPRFPLPESRISNSESRLYSPRSAFRTCLRLAAVAVALGALVPLAALAWDDHIHELIVREAVTRLPDPLHGLLADENVMKRLEAASIAADARRQQLRAAHSPQEAQERIKHFFDIDAISGKPYPFEGFPHDRAAAEKEFGADTFKKHGTAPWAAEDALEALTAALKKGAGEDAVVAAAGDLAHYAADIHMPLHVTHKDAAAGSPNAGLHLMLEVGLVKRYPDFYTAAVSKDRAEVSYLASPLDSIFQWILQAYKRSEVVLKADAQARAQTHYPSDENEARNDIDKPGAERAAEYYRVLKEKLAAGALPEDGAPPEAAAMRDAAAHTADLFYTAWVNAGKPEKLAAAAAAAPASEDNSYTYWMLLGMVVLTVLLVLPRRRPMQR
jgi:hypothetical protein